MTLKDVMNGLLDIQNSIHEFDYDEAFRVEGDLYVQVLIAISEGHPDTIALAKQALLARACFFE